ncbi:MAG: RNA polymerase sigma factor [Rikenellaceae bacterium]|nr:RNA polymerase sigma factor [Rikenellaceae bacterium]
MTTTHETTLPACSELRNEAFDRLVGVLLRPIYWHVRRLVVEHDEAEEITQETFVRAFEQFDQFRGSDGELRAWVYRIATNLAISALRRRRRSIFTSIDQVSRELANRVADFSPPDIDVRLIEFQQAVLGLPTKQRVVFNLRYYDDLSYAQIATATGQSEQAAKTCYHYAVKRLKEQLNEWQL